MCVYEDQVLIFARRFWCTNSGDTVVHEYLGGNIRFILGERNFSTSIGVCFEPQITSCALAFIVKHTFYIWTIGLYQQQYSSIDGVHHTQSLRICYCMHPLNLIIREDYFVLLSWRTCLAVREMMSH